MTMPDLNPEYAELRRLAEAANADVVQGATYQRDWPLSSRAVGQFLRALNPDLALALLDAAAERDELAAKVERRTTRPLTPLGLCGNRADHEPHLMDYVPVANGPMWCHADQTKRLPYARERNQP